MIDANPSPTVLIVENEAMIRMTAIDALVESGLTVLEAGGAADALLLLGRHPEIVLLVTDIDMPGQMDGLDLAVQAVRDRPGLRLILSSGRGGFAGRTVPREGKCLAKPYYVDKLVTLVHQELLITEH